MKGFCLCRYIESKCGVIFPNMVEFLVERPEYIYLEFFFKLKALKYLRNRSIRLTVFTKRWVEVLSVLRKFISIFFSRNECSLLGLGNSTSHLLRFLDWERMWVWNLETLFTVVHMISLGNDTIPTLGLSGFENRTSKNKVMGSKFKCFQWGILFKSSSSFPMEILLES